MQCITTSELLPKQGRGIWMCALMVCNLSNCCLLEFGRLKYFQKALRSSCWITRCHTHNQPSITCISIKIFTIAQTVPSFIITSHLPDFWRFLQTIFLPFLLLFLLTFYEILTEVLLPHLLCPSHLFRVKRVRRFAPWYLLTRNFLSLQFLW